MNKSSILNFLILYHLVVYGCGIKVKESTTQHSFEPKVRSRGKEGTFTDPETSVETDQRGVVFVKETDSKKIELLLYESLKYFFLQASIFSTDFDEMEQNQKKSGPKCYAEIEERCLIETFETAIKKKDISKPGTWRTPYFPEHLKIYKNGKITLTRNLENCLTFNCLHRPHVFETLETFTAKSKKPYFFSTYISISVKDFGLHYDVSKSILYMDFQGTSYEFINVKRLLGSLISYSDLKNCGKVVQNVEAFYDKSSSHSSNRLMANFEYDVLEKNKKSFFHSLKNVRTLKNTESTQAYQHVKTSLDYPMTALTLPIFFLAEPTFTLAALLKNKFSNIEIPKTSGAMLQMGSNSEKDIIPVNNDSMQEDFLQWVQKCNPMNLFDVFDHFLRMPSFTFKVVAVTLYEENQFIGFHGFVDELSKTSTENDNIDKEPGTSPITKTKWYAKLETTHLETRKKLDSSPNLSSPKLSKSKSSSETIPTEKKFQHYYSFIKASVGNNFISKGANDYGFIELNSEFLLIKKGKQLIFKNCLMKQSVFY